MPAAQGEKPDAKPDPDKPGYWATDWRERLSAGDEKELKQLSRYASPEDIWKKSRALEAKLSAGQLKPVPGKDATPEELAEFRKAWGVPEKADGYDLAGVKVDDNDRPMLGEVMKAMHGVNATPEAVKAVANAWAQIKTQSIEYQADIDRKAQQEAEDALRSEWGTEFRRNLSLVHQLLDASGDDKLKDQILSGRLADGTPIGSSPAALKMLLGVALKENPTATLVPSGSGDPAANIETRIAQIEKMMREDRKAYNDPKISGDGGEYQRLLEARAKLQARS